MAYAFSNEKAITCSKTYDNKRRTQDTPARSSEKNNAKEDVEEWGGCIKIIKKVGCLFCFSLEMGILAAWSGNLHK